MTTEGFDALFDSFTRSAYRLETLPVYAIPAEDPAYLAWLTGAARPERSVRTSPWMRRIAVTTATGKRWARTRVLDAPLTDYQRFQIPAYVESQAVGEQIRVVRRDVVGHDAQDFWLFDDETDSPWAVLMEYGEDGAFTGYQVVRGALDVQRLRRTRRLFDSLSIPLAEFLALENARG